MLKLSINNQFFLPLSPFELLQAKMMSELKENWNCTWNTIYLLLYKLREKPNKHRWIYLLELKQEEVNTPSEIKFDIIIKLMIDSENYKKEQKQAKTD